MKKVLPLVVAASLLLSTATSFAATNENATGKFLEKKFNVTDSTKEFKTVKAQIDELGYKHEVVQQVVNGVPVYGKQYMVNYDANGNVYYSKGQYDAKAKTAKLNTALTAKQAIEFVKTDVNFKAADTTKKLMADQFSADLYLYEVDGQYVPTYMVKANWLHENTFGNYVAFVNANTGEIVNKIDNTQYTTATGTGIGVLGDSKSIYTDYTGGTYYLKDIYRTAQTITYDAKNGTSSLYNMTDADNNWNLATHKPAVDAHFYTGRTVDYYKNVLGWNGMDGNNIQNKNVVHYSTNYVNAFWNGTYLVYGDGDGVQSLALAGGLDIVAHEYSHGVTEKLGGLTYQNESGALNEAFSDIMATAVEKYVQPTKFDWLVGEDVWTPGTAGDALRSMADPTLYGDPDHYSTRYVGTQDNGGVHWNSGIVNHAAYTMVTSGGITTDDMAKIFFRANRYYFSLNCTFSEARQDTLQAATDLYGAGSAAYNAVVAGWNHVGVN